jgi:hypothetical protein
MYRKKYKTDLFAILYTPKKTVMVCFCVKVLVDRHNGDIKAYLIDIGTKIEISLPILLNGNNRFSKIRKLDV